MPPRTNHHARDAVGCARRRNGCSHWADRPRQAWQGCIGTGSRARGTAMNSAVAPNVVILGGPNGAGKSTVARAVLADELGLTEFVNADAIAQGLSGFDPDRVAFAAGRIMLERLHELAAA